MILTRDFSTISPSARSLLLVKAHTQLPYARQAAELVFGAEAVAAAGGANAAARRRHFELRTQSIDEALDAHASLLAGPHARQRVLELAAGLSFRGLDRAARSPVDYLETDLPAMIETKSALIAQLAPPALTGTLRVEPLDALDRAAFAAAVTGLPAGPLAIVHEGLLMYLDDGEKAQLAGNIRAALRARGGAWITADIYVRSERHLPREPHTEQFLAEHRVDDNKFADWAAADALFAAQGFRVVDKRVPAADPWPVRQTWAMVLA